MTPFELAKIVDRETKKLELMLGKFIYSGFNIWTTQKIEETYLLKSKHMGRMFQLKIDHTS